MEQPKVSAYVQRFMDTIAKERETMEVDRPDIDAINEQYSDNADVQNLIKYIQFLEWEMSFPSTLT